MDVAPAHIRSLQAIVRYGGYHRAADALHLTQPAISRHVRRLEDQLGEPLFTRRGRGVELTAFGERAVAELGEALTAHDQAVGRLARGSAAPFVLGTVENLIDPVLPGLLSVVREQLGERSLQLRVDRSAALAESFARGEIDAALVFEPGAVPEAIDLGTLTLRWWTAVSQRSTSAAQDPHGPLPLVAYTAPCSLRDLALTRVRELHRDPLVTAESPHLSGVQAAARNGLGYALLAAGGDGLRPVTDGPLAEPIQARLWLLLGSGHAALARPLRAALWRAGAHNRTAAVAA